MLEAASAPYRSKRIHLGMDEAYTLGLGKYIQLHGAVPRFEIMNSHMAKVREITQKLGLKPMIWSDMYFALAAPEGGDYYDPATMIPDDLAEKIPKDLQLIYWDYYRPDKEFYSLFIDKHRQLGSDPIFATGIWMWHVFWLNFTRTRVNMNAGMTACREKGVREAIATLWNDDGTEADFMSMFPALQVFADNGYHSGVSDETLRRQFMGSCGSEIDQWLIGSRLDATPGLGSMREYYADIGMKLEESIDPELVDDPEKWVTSNPSKWMFWQDPFVGLFDAQIQGFPLAEHYKKLSKDLRKAARKGGEAEPHLLFALRLSEALEDKAELGLRLQSAYLNGDLEALREMKSKVLPRLIRNIERAHEQHRINWFSTYKALGWEVIDVRYGGLVSRLRTVIQRLDDYLSGRIERIEELDEEKLPVVPGDGCHLPWNTGSRWRYRNLISPSIWS
jgi:hexosaminidase